MTISGRGLVITLILIIWSMLQGCGSEYDNDNGYDQLSDITPVYEACGRFLDDIQSATTLDLINQIVEADVELYHCKEILSQRNEPIYMFLVCQDDARRLWIEWSDLYYYQSLGFEACVYRDLED